MAKDARTLEKGGDTQRDEVVVTRRWCKPSMEMVAALSRAAEKRFRQECIVIRKQATRRL